MDEWAWNVIVRDEPVICAVANGREFRVCISRDVVDSTRCKRILPCHSAVRFAQIAGTWAIKVLLWTISDHKAVPVFGSVISWVLSLDINSVSLTVVIREGCSVHLNTDLGAACGNRERKVVWVQFLSVRLLRKHTEVEVVIRAFCTFCCKGWIIVHFVVVSQLS